MTDTSRLEIVESRSISVILSFKNTVVRFYFIIKLHISWFYFSIRIKTLPESCFALESILFVCDFPNHRMCQNHNIVWYSFSQLIWSSDENSFSRTRCRNSIRITWNKWPRSRNRYGEVIQYFFVEWRWPCFFIISTTRENKNDTQQ